jgi:putative sigma-54 modulation protein
MITSIDLVGLKYAIDDNTRKYVMRKIGRLDRYLPAHARKSVTAEIRLRMVNRDHGNKHEAEVILVVPDKTITAKDSTTNMMAAIDIVEAKLLAQLRRYKQERLNHIGNRGLMARFKRSYAREL